MMEPSKAIIITTLFGFTIAALWIFYFWIYWKYRIDKTRQELFAIRDELFDFAATGNISFQHPAYFLLRKLMNGMIQFTHKIDFITTIALLYTHKNTPPRLNFYSEFNKAVLSIESEKTKKELQRLLYQMHKVVILHLLKSSCFSVGILLLIMVVIVLFEEGWKNLKSSIAAKFPGITQIDNEAAMLG